MPHALCETLHVAQHGTVLTQHCIPGTFSAITYYTWDEHCVSASS